MDTDTEEGGQRAIPIAPVVWDLQPLDVWREPGGLSMVVPAGWDGRTPGEALLDLRHRESGVRIEVRAGAPDSGLDRLDVPGCKVTFANDGAHRAVPVLGLSSAVTCASTFPGGPTIQAWYGRVGDRVVQVRVVFPPGGVVSGRAVVDPILSALVVLP